MSENTKYPELTEQGKQDAQRIMDSFKDKLRGVVDEILSELYTNVSYYVDTDHWANYRNAILDGFRGYKRGDRSRDYKEIRESILKNHRQELIDDLNQDMRAEIERLNKLIESMRDDAERAYAR